MNTARYTISVSATLLFSLTLNILFMSYAPPSKKGSNANTPKGFAVVELFTSEGCSSCPPADAVVAKVSSEYKNNVFVLGFHVDYWNYLGWKDPFSSELYSKRQQQYGAAFHLNSVYTPQVVVNGRAEFTGSDEDKLRTTITKQLAGAAAATITFTAKSRDAKTVTVLFSTAGAANAVVNIALVQSHATTAVQRGENKGLALNHVNVVRDFKTVDAVKSQAQDVALTIPAGLTAKDCSIIVYLQDKETLRVSAAAEASIE